MPVLAPGWRATEIDDRLGWTGNNFSLRTAFGKRACVRAAAGDGGVFDASMTCGYDELWESRTPSRREKT